MTRLEELKDALDEAYRQFRYAETELDRTEVAFINARAAFQAEAEKEAKKR